MVDLFAAMEKVKELAITVGKMQKDNLGRKDLAMNTKSTSIDLVTEIDKQSEQMIIKFIRKNYPCHSILAEESGLAASETEYLWVVDPLDGTTNFSQGLPIFAVSIALQYKNETVLGVVYAPVVDQLFTAIKGQGAFLNGKRLQVSAKEDLAKSVLATGFPYDIRENPINNLAYFNRLLPSARAIRRMGAAAYDLACVAAGFFDGFWELKLSLWDVAAAVLLVEEAGGKIVYFRQDRGISLIAGNEVICGAILEEIKQVDHS
ncbi:MAG: histidinol-phosphatase [Firmicutes bacterium]|nr:histidinol-phosphatase [Bacillota bacterium]